MVVVACVCAKPAFATHANARARPRIVVTFCRLQLLPHVRSERWSGPRDSPSLRITDVGTTTCRSHATAKVMPSLGTESLRSACEAMREKRREIDVLVLAVAREARSCLGIRRVLSHAPRENTQSFARRSQRNTRVLACSRGIARWHRRCPFLARDGPDRTKGSQNAATAPMNEAVTRGSG